MTVSRFLFPALILMLTAGVAVAQGPDVIVGDLTGPANYSSLGGIDAFAVGTTSCNIGTSNLSWIGNTPDHPVIGQTLYRIKDGTFEQVGMAWLKHGFGALQGNVCMTCTGTGSWSALGVGCSDPYGASLNGTQSPLGARSEVNAATGVFPYPTILNPPVSGSVDRRLQVAHTDLDPTLNAGAIYVVEAQYVAADDSAAGNDNNNSSYRLCTFTSASGTYSMSFQGPTEREKPAIQAWQDLDPSVAIHNEDIPGDGRVIIGFRVVQITPTLSRYIYAVQNLNSDRSIGSFSVALPAGGTTNALAFHDVDYHSGEVYSGTDWTGSVASNGVSWVTAQTYAQNPNANALRWGTAYTFTFESTVAPGDITLGLFKPGTPTMVTIPALPIPTPAWQINQAGAHLDIDGATNDGFVSPIHVDKISGTAGVLNIGSTESGNSWEIFLTSGPGLPNAIVLPAGQIVNLDLTDPSLSSFGFLNSPGFPAGGISIPFLAPMASLSTSMQMVVFAPTQPDGLFLSALNEVTVTPAPTIVVEAQGANSFINNVVGTGYWKVTHNGNTAAHITKVIFDFNGAAGTISTRQFDTDQSAMGGGFTLGSTYRNNSDVLTGLDYSVSTPHLGSGWIGTNPGAGLQEFQTIEFNFVGGAFFGQTLGFDVDTDGGPGSQSGASQAGMQVTIHMSDGAIHSGILAVDPAATNRSVLEFN